MLEDSNQTAEGRLLAAIDLGSNSFHMVVARVVHGEARPVERLAERVQLAAGMHDGGRLSDEAVTRGVACLARFRQALDTLGPDSVRIVATNALRVARNGREFRAAAESVVGYPVEVISGREEARLVYLGVAHTLADDNTRLVVDIGGGSTEFVIGERFEARLMESLYMGCVSFSERFFPERTISAGQFEAAYLAASREVLNIRGPFQRHGWQNVVGSSGTLRAIEKVIAAEGWADAGVSAANLDRLRRTLLRFEDFDSLKQLSGLSERRRDVFVAGVAITAAFFDTLGVDEMRTSTGALREGVIYDQIGRLSHEDVRERSVSAMMQRYAADDFNASRVEETARHLFQGVRDSCDLDDDDLDLLVRAARLHEVGLAISHSGFHKHGQYLVENSDLPGFSRLEQMELGLLIRGHRQKFPREELRSRGNGRERQLENLCLLLRLAVLFKYVAPVEGQPAVSLVHGCDGMLLKYPRGWLQRHPLTRYALQREQELLARKGITLELDYA